MHSRKTLDSEDLAEMEGILMLLIRAQDDDMVHLWECNPFVR